MRTPWYRQVILMSLLVLLLFFVLVPFYWMLTSSVKMSPEIISRRVTLIPQSFVLDHYTQLFTSSPFIKYTGN